MSVFVKIPSMMITFNHSVKIATLNVPNAYGVIRTPVFLATTLTNLGNQMVTIIAFAEKGILRPGP